MTTNWSAMRAMSLSSILVRFGVLGAFSGLGAWVLVLAVRMAVDGSSPGWLALLLAIPRGALFGMILAGALHMYWKRHPGKSETKGH